MAILFINDSIKVVSCILIALCALSICCSKTIDKSEENVVVTSKYQLGNQTRYESRVLRDYTNTNVTHAPYHCRSPGWHDTILNCFNNKTHLRVGFCATYDPDSDTASIALCPYFRPGVFHVIKHKGAHYIALPENVADINDSVCRPMNRKGRVCRECMDGYGPAVMSVGYDIQCSNCTGVWYVVPLFLFLEFFPITAFYFIIFIFQINITSGSITCFIMYSQLLIIAYDCIVAGDNFEITDIMLTASPNSKLLLKILLTAYDIWNLRFFRYLIPPFCISSTLKPIHLVFISYISVFYPLCLIIITWVCIELHGYNFRPLVWLCKPFLTDTKCFIRLKRRWNPKNDFVSVFASFFLLSFTKVLFQLIFVLTYQRLQYVVYSTGEYLGNDLVVEYDMSVFYGSNEQVMFAAITVLFFFMLNVLPTLLLIFYPFSLCQTILSKCGRVQIPLNHFVQQFNSCYKDGQNGVKDMRSFAGLYFAVRLTLFSFNGISGILLISKNDPFLSRNIIFTITVLLIALCRPYKKTYMNVLDTLLLAHLGISSHLMSSYYGFQHQTNFVIAFEVMAAIPIIGLVIVFLIQILQKIFNSQAPQIALQKCKAWCCLFGIHNARTHIAANDGTVIERTVVGISASNSGYGSINQLPPITV